MKKIIVLILVFALSGNLIVRAQSRFPIKTTSVWRINYEFPRYEWTTHASGDEEYKYFIGGDTIISGKNYFKLLKSGVLYLETPFIIRNKYIGAIRDSENKFYFVANKSDAETLLYDFDAGVGGYIADKDLALRQISTIEVLPSGRKKYMFDFITVHCGSANTVIEGIGWLGGLLEGNSCSGHPGVRGSYLMCYSEDGTAKFESDIALMYDLSCTEPITSLSDIIKQNLTFSLSSSVLKVYSANNSAPIESVEIYNVLGNKVLEEKVNSLQEYITNIAFLERGLYLLKVSGNGQNNVFKFIINK
jgi:hypothetical protein